MKGHVIGTVFKWILYFSSYVPVFFMIFLKNLKAFTGKEFQKTWNLNSNFWIILIVMSVLTLIALIFWLIILKKETEIKTKSIEVSKYVLKDSEVLNFFVTYIIPILSLGGKGVISVLSNVMPKFTHEMTYNYFNGNVDIASKMQLDVLDLIDALFCEVNPIPVKYALNLMGYDFGVPRLPLVELSDSNKEKLKNIMRKHNLIIEV